MNTKNRRNRRKAPACRGFTRMTADQENRNAFTKENTKNRSDLRHRTVSPESEKAKPYR